MDTFKRIRSGISDLKKEKDELKAKYDVLANELTKVVESNRLEIRGVSQRTMATSAALAASSERMKKLEGGIGEVEGRLTAGIAALEKRADDYKRALIEAGERIQKAQNAAEEAKKGVRAGKEDDKTLTRYIDELEKRIGGLSSMREKIRGIEKAGEVLLKGVQDLEALSGSVEVIKERLSGLESSIGEKAAQTESKLSSDIASMKKDIRGNSLTIKGIDAALDRSALDLQAVRKDLESERAGIARVRGHAAQNRKRLELLGTLQSQIKNLEAVKDGLVRGVESNKEMKAKLAGLDQKTRDIDARLTGADKALDSKLLDKAADLDRQISEKTAAMESQMQESLRSLEANLTEKGRTLETKVVERGKRLEAGVSAELAGMRNTVAEGRAGFSNLRSDLQKLNARIRDLRSISAGSKAEIRDVRDRLSSVTKRVLSLEALRETVKVIEDAKDAMLDVIGDVAEVREGLGVLDEKGKSLEARLAGDTGALRADLDKAVSGLRTDQLATGKRVASLEKLKEKTRDIAKLERSLSASLREVKPVLRQAAELRLGLESARKEAKNADMAIEDKVENSSRVLEGKLDYNVSSLKKETGFNAAALAKLDEEIKGMSLDMQAMRKDWQAGKRDMSEMQAALSNSERKLGDMEKLQIRLGEIEQAKDAQSTAMDSRIEQNVKSLEAGMRQRVKSIEADLGEKTKAVEAKIRSEIGGIRKDIAAKSNAIEKIRTRLESLGRFEERLGFIDEEKEEIERSVASLQAMKANQAGIDERARSLGKEVKELRSSLARGLADIRSEVDSASAGGREKFDSAVKAFLTTRGELSSQMNGINVKILELEKRMNEFSRSLLRIDMVEKKLDRISERSTEMRREMDKLETKEEAGEKVMLVDLEPEKEEG